MGHHNRHFAGDPHALHGAWSPPTSTAKYAACRTSHHAVEANDASFCEEDYDVSRYIAEFINSLTNLAYGMWVSLLESWNRSLNLSFRNRNQAIPVEIVKAPQCRR